MRDGTPESFNHSRYVIPHIPFYAEHLGALLRTSDEWLRRRVASYTVLDADTIRLHMSVDFDLTECREGLRYLTAMKAERRRYFKKLRHEGMRHLRTLQDPIPFLLPIGLHSDPYIGFDLRYCDESRVSLITRKERNQITESAQFRKQLDSPLGDVLKTGELAIVELPSTGSSGRGVLHYTQLLRWRADRKAFEFLPPSLDDDRAAWYTKMRLRRILVMIGWRPLRVVIPLLNVYLCESYHIELHTPEGIRIHRPSIVTYPRSGSQEIVSEKTRELPPPSHAYAFTHWNSIQRLDGYPLIFRAWLCLDRRGFTSVVMFLAILNSLVCAGSIAAVAPFRDTGPDITALVPVLVLAAAAAFAYLYMPGEHGLTRGLYSYLRWLLVAIASSTLIVAADLDILNSFLSPLIKGNQKPSPNLGIFGSIDWARHHLGVLGNIALFAPPIIVILMAIGTLVLIITWRKARDQRVADWVDDQIDSGKYTQFGWHTVEPIHIPPSLQRLT